jgi:hypothetical protein
MTSNLTIACVWWKGEFRNRDYTARHVHNLHMMVDKHIDVPYEFVCLTNAPDDLCCRKVGLEFPDDLPGWWSKLELFKGGWTDSKAVLYLDLDTFICDSLDDLISYNGALTFCPPLDNPSGKGVVKRFQSSAILFDPKLIKLDLNHVIKDQVRDRYRGDQDFMGVVFDDLGRTFPVRWFIKLKNCWNSGPPAGVKVILGNPKSMWMMAEDKQWIKELMR